MAACVAGQLGILGIAAGCLLLAAPAAAEVAQSAQAGGEQQGEIIVTARRREELLQRTPVSVVALLEADLEDRSVTNLRTLQNFVPNLTLAPSQNVGEAAGNTFIRGIGQEDFIAGSQPGVGFYLDGVYLATTRGTLMNLIDVARIEVLRGPQGTLFGRNTIGGAINVISVQPQPERRAKFSAIAGSFDRIELRSVLNAPLAPGLFVRLSAGMVRRNGYLRRLSPPVPLGPLLPVNNEREGSDHTQSGRLQLRWLATDSLTVDLALEGTRRRNTQGALRVDEINPGVGTIRILNQLIRTGSLPGVEITNDLLPDGFYESFAGNRNFADLDNWGVSANVNGTSGIGALRLILAFRDLRTRIGTDSDGLYYGIGGSEFRDTQRQFSGELQLNGTAGRLTYTAGVYAFREWARSLPSRGILSDEVLFRCGCYPTANLPQPITVRRKLNTQSYALYGQGTHRITPRLSATLGGRYSYDRQSIFAQTVLVDLESLRATDSVVSTGANRDDWGAVTWRAGLEYQATSDLMVYGSAAKGFKSGGFNVRPVRNLPNLGLASFDPEMALTYEIGLRSQWFDRRFRLNLTLFHSDYEDIQLRQQTLTPVGVTTLIENAAKARTRGVEIEVTARLVEGLTLGVAYGHIDAKYLDVGRVPNLTLASRFQRTPSHSLALFADYELAVPFGTVELHGDFSYRSREQFQLIARRFDQEGYGLIGARLAFRSTDDRWTVAIFATNLANKYYRTAGRGTAADGAAFSSVGMPRQVGVQLQAQF